MPPKSSMRLGPKAQDITRISTVPAARTYTTLAAPRIVVTGAAPTPFLNSNVSPTLTPIMLLQPTPVVAAPHALQPEKADVMSGLKAVSSRLTLIQRETGASAAAKMTSPLQHFWTNSRGHADEIESPIAAQTTTQRMTVKPLQRSVSVASARTRRFIPITAGGLLASGASALASTAKTSAIPVNFSTGDFVLAALAIAAAAGVIAYFAPHAWRRWRAYQLRERRIEALTSAETIRDYGARELGQSLSGFRTVGISEVAPATWELVFYFNTAQDVERAVLPAQVDDMAVRKSEADEGAIARSAQAAMNVGYELLEQRQGKEWSPRAENTLNASLLLAIAGAFAYSVPLGVAVIAGLIVLGMGILTFQPPFFDGPVAPRIHATVASGTSHSSTGSKSEKGYFGESPIPPTTAEGYIRRGFMRSIRRAI
ncbi:MAG: hypothetical protein HYZ74_03025 [Elusimicrobia bacterium]|nr:hypothetical protein [Elusimicrobiota bacterium]